MASDFGTCTVHVIFEINLYNGHNNIQYLFFFLNIFFMSVIKLKNEVKINRIIFF
jgi:hypothetical protein